MSPQTVKSAVVQVVFADGSIQTYRVDPDRPMTFTMKPLWFNPNVPEGEFGPYSEARPTVYDAVRLPSPDADALVIVCAAQADDTVMVMEAVESDDRLLAEVARLRADLAAEKARTAEYQRALDPA